MAKECGCHCLSRAVPTDARIAFSPKRGISSMVSPLQRRLYSFFWISFPLPISVVWLCWGENPLNRKTSAVCCLFSAGFVPPIPVKPYGPSAALRWKNCKQRDLIHDVRLLTRFWRCWMSWWMAGLWRSKKISLCGFGEAVTNGLLTWMPRGQWGRSAACQSEHRDKLRDARFAVSIGKRASHLALFCLESLCLHI